MLFMCLSIEWIFDQIIANTLDLVEVVDGKLFRDARSHWCLILFSFAYNLLEFADLLGFKRKAMNKHIEFVREG